MGYNPEIFLFGRILVSGFFIMGSLNHFKGLEMMSKYAASKKVPMPKLAVSLTGLMLLLGGLSILLGVYTLYGIGLLSLFLAGVSFKMHNFWAVPEKEKMEQQINFTKNMALLGSLLMFLAISQPWTYALSF